MRVYTLNAESIYLGVNIIRVLRTYYRLWITVQLASTGTPRHFWKYREQLQLNNLRPCAV